MMLIDNDKIETDEEYRERMHGAYFGLAVMALAAIFILIAFDFIHIKI